MDRIFNLPMKKTTFPLLIFMLVLLSWGCKDEVQSFSILRQPLVTFQTDTFTTQSTTNAIFYGGAAAIHVFPDINAQRLFRRFILESSGRNSQGRDFWLQIEVDVVTNGQFIGVYRPEYNITLGGLHDLRYTIRNGNSFTTYGLAPGSNEAYAQVERQNNEESILRGIFAGTLINRTDTTQPGIELFNGTFIDIPY